MREADCLRELRERLVRHGLPRHRLERILREVTEHWDDTYAAASRQGLDTQTARAQADIALGRPASLADSFVAQLRRNTWLGRHWWLAMAALPTVLLLVVFAVMALPLWGMDAVTNFTESPFWKRPPYVQFGIAALWTLYGAGTTTVPLVLSWWAWRVGLGRRFVWLIWASCLFASAFRFFDASAAKHQVVLGFRFPPGLDAHGLTMLFLHIVAGVIVFALIRFSNQQRSVLLQPYEN